jgi:hypothetical protein
MIMKKLFFFLAIAASFFAQAQTATTKAKIRALTSRPASTVQYWVSDSGQQSHWYLAAGDRTSKDDTVNILVSRNGDRFYRHVEDPRNYFDSLKKKVPAPPTVYNGSGTFTASCGGGYTGGSSTATATATSTISQADANNKAAALAQQMAIAALKCTAIPPPSTTYTSTKSFTAHCDAGSTGADVVKSATATSTVSQADADSKALQQATVAATAALNCTAVPQNGTFTATKTYTATCPPGYTGVEVTRTATATSTISQADADYQALSAAATQANVARRCSEIIVPVKTPNVGMEWAPDSSMGGMNGGTSILVLEIPMPNLKIGDQILVIDPNLVYGTSGLGGQWPFNSGYATLSEMQRDTTQEQGYYSWVRETGQVYRYDRANHNWYEFHKDSHYIEKANPYSLVAIVQGISLDRRTIILSKIAQKSVTHAKVYLDNAARLQKFFPDYKSFTEGGGQFKIPSGSFAFSRLVAVKNHDVEIYGAGKDSTLLFCPPGVPGAASFLFNQTDRVQVHDFTIDAGFRHTGWAFAPEGMPTADGFDNPFVVTPTLGLLWNENHAWNMRLIRPMAYGFYIGGSNSWVDNSEVIYPPGDEPIDYCGWPLLAGQANGGGFRNCTFTASNLANAFEAFTSIDVSFIGCKVTNGINSLNSSGGCIIRNFTANYTAGAHNNIRINAGHPVWEANDFINGSRNGRGAIFDSVTITQPYSLDAGGEFYLNGIFIRGQNITNVTVTNYKYSRPDLTDHAAGRAQALTATTNGIHLENIIIEGKEFPEIYKYFSKPEYTPYFYSWKDSVIAKPNTFFLNGPKPEFCNIGLTDNGGSGVIKNVSAGLIYVGDGPDGVVPGKDPATVILENVKADMIITGPTIKK